jgi:hypothetical protein
MSDTRILKTFEVLDYTPEVIKESLEKNNGKIILKGIIQKADVLNQNGRIYPLAILQREVRNYQKFIIENRALGELDHPDTSVVEYKNSSHIMREVYIDNGAVYGSLEILDKVPSGAILRGLVESNVKIGISSRGVGSTRKQGDYQVVQDDFQIICWDVVSDPSTSGAFMLPEGRIIESVEKKNIFTKSDRINRVVNDILFSKK